MQPRIRVVMVAVAATLLAACGSDSSSPRQTFLRVIHASPDAPKVNVILDGDAILTEVDYKQGSGFSTLRAGFYDAAVEAITPAGNATVIELNDAELERNTEYTVLAVGRVANGSLAPLVVANPRAAVPSGQVRVQVVHASPDAPPVDVYVTAPAASLAGALPLGSFAFQQTLGPVEVAGGSYRIRVTPAGSDTVVFDSGTVALPAGADLLVAAVTSTVAGDSPISLLVNDGATQSEILDTALGGAAIRVAHLSPDAPAVDVVVNDDFVSPLFTGAAYPGVTGYVLVPPDTYNVKVVDSPGQNLTVINADLDLASGIFYTAAAVNVLASIEPLVLEDDRRSIATEARVRIVHASPTAGNVDIYVTAPGVDVSTGTVAPTLGNAPFKANSGYVALAEGAYDVTVTPAGNPAVAAIEASLDLVNGDIYTVFARDAAGGGVPLGLVVVDETT